MRRGAPGGNFARKSSANRYCPSSARYRRAVPADNAHGSFLLFVTSLTRPVSAACRRTYSLITHHSSLKSPVALPGGNRCTAQSLPGHWGVPRHRRGGGIPRVTGFHIGLYHEEVPAVNPSVAFGASSHRPGALRAVPADNFARWISANRYFPDPPGIVSLCDTGLFQAINRQRGNETPHNSTNQKRGQGQSIRNPSQSEGSIPVGSSRGILKGGIIRAGASYSPLEPASLLPFLPEQERKALLASTCRRLLGE